ncbi:MFS transporter [Gracilibacillus phocaeensis]|uniref:MFS transporter n=1 Tax=Gracilibacillus phocaeensis TaxID=2042304 RepID=UPI00102F8A0C|nr:MFS transporter [Gracilibacillus phocaeensis]
MNTHTKGNEKISFKEKMGFGFGDLAVNFSWASLGMFIVYFYTDVIGLGAGIVGTIMLFSRVLDGFSDIAMGAVVDKTNTKYGKARPWILWLAIPFSVLTVALFAVPDISYTWKIVYVIVSYNLLVLSFTSVVIPYGTLNTLITQDKPQREVLNLYRMFFAQIGVLIVTNLTMPLVDQFGGGQSGWVLTYAIFATIAALLFFTTFKTTKERVKPVKVEQNKKIKLKDSLKTLSKNKYWVIVFGYFIVFSIGDGLRQGSTVYYADNILDMPGLVGALTIAFTVPVIVGFFALPVIFSKFGKRNAIIAGSFISILGCLFVLIEPGSVWVVVISQIIRGIGSVPLIGALWALLPDTIEYGEWKTGIRNEGVLYSGGSMGQKIGIGIGTASVGWVLAIGGYNGVLDVQPDSAIDSIYAVFVYLPIVVYLLQIILMYFYKLDKFYHKVASDLEVRKQS